MSVFYCDFVGFSILVFSMVVFISEFKVKVA